MASIMPVCHVIFFPIVARFWEEIYVFYSIHRWCMFYTWVLAPVLSMTICLLRACYHSVKGPTGRAIRGHSVARIWQVFPWDGPGNCHRGQPCVHCVYCRGRLDIVQPCQTNWLNRSHVRLRLAEAVRGDHINLLDGANSISLLSQRLWDISVSFFLYLSP